MLTQNPLQMMFVVSGDLPDISDETVGVIEEIVRDQIHEIVSYWGPVTTERQN